MNYYNENDPKAAAWLRELIKDGHISEGVVDERSIVDVQPDELVRYRQCHFFAGIGGWSYALRLAGVPDDEPIWTGSCPCQPFSNAGLQLGTADERHLWPIFFNLIRECGPATVFGEQVASKAGRSWLAGVFADLEGVAYAAAGADLCAAGVGAPHIRQRLFWVANPNPNSDRLQTVSDEGSVCFSPHDRKRTRRFGEMGSAPFWISPCPPGARAVVLGNGVYGEVDMLRGYGNAIVPQVAEVFIRAYYDV